ncbi:MAG TPA: hypothetical protein VHZ74_17790 [Bryobacteraceae bacterium]|nr:hypothetical protein [Bryobacteraceae bacterium]
MLAVLCSAQSGSFVPVVDVMLQKPDPADWLMWRRTLDSRGYSSLNQVNRSNAGQLKMVWTRATGDVIWEYKRELPPDVTKFLLVPSINRNLAIYGNFIIDTSVDDFVYALDARTGKLAWENRIVDYREDSAQETSGPIIANGKIISGRGCEFQSDPERLHHYRA